MSLNEFIRLYSQQPFELVNENRIALLPQLAGHGEIVQNLWFRLDQHESSGEAILRTPFVELDSRGDVFRSLTPDVMFYTSQRIIGYKSTTATWRVLPYVIVPDLVIEVVSPNDDLRKLDEKVDLYLADGVRMVWAVDPEPCKVSVYVAVPDKAQTKQQTTLSSGDVLKAEDIIPGFEINIDRLFE